MSASIPPWGSLLEQLSDAIADAVRAAYSADDVPLTPFSRPPKAELGELAYACFPLARIARKNPAQIAQTIATAVSRSEVEGMFEAITPAGPYINFRLKAAALFEAVDAAIQGDVEGYGRSNAHAGERVMVEFSAPNTNKPQHLGHLRNNALGWAASSLLSAVGYDVIRANLINDRGVHICKSMLAYQRWGNGVTPETEGLKGDHLVGSFYVRFSQALKEEKASIREAVQRETGLEGDALEAHLERHAPLARAAQTMLQQWEAGDEDVRALWERMNSWVFKGFDETYARMGIRFDKIYRESETYQRGKDIIQDALEKGLVYQKEDGSTWIDLTEDGYTEKILLRSDGTSIYTTQDIGTAVIKHEEFGMSRSIYVVANEQDYHFKLLFAALARLGYAWASGLFHLNYGMVNLPEGKMKSREGTVVDADDLMDELEAACLEKAREASAQGTSDEREDELVKTSRQVAQGALKFFILKVNPRKDMIFNPKESISLQGDTGPYVQYAHARIRSLLRRGTAAGIDLASGRSSGGWSMLGNAEERAVALSVARFPEVVAEAAEKLAPSTLTTYLLELATAFNRFYNAHQVLGADQNVAAARLALCENVGVTLKAGLGLMGIEAPEAM